MKTKQAIINIYIEEGNTDDEDMIWGDMHLDDMTEEEMVVLYQLVLKSTRKNYNAWLSAYFANVKEAIEEEMKNEQ